MTQEINILYYMRLFNRNKIALILLVGVTAVFCIVVGATKPRMYASTTTVLIPFSMPGSSSSGQFGSVLSAVGIYSGRSMQDAIVAIVKSRRMAQDVANNFQFEKRYSVNKDNAIKRAQKALFIYMIESGLAIEATTEDAQLSANVANFCTKNLDSINYELKLSTEIPFVKVLDRAIPAQEPSSRNILKNTTVGIMVSGLVGILVILFIDYISRLKENYHQEVK